MTIRLEHNPVVICQCILPCFQPFREDGDGEWSDVGCLLPKGHEGDHGAEGPGEITYRSPSEPHGPRVVLRWRPETASWYGQCHQCERGYAVAEATAIKLRTSEEER